MNKAMLCGNFEMSLRGNLIQVPQPFLKEMKGKKLIISLFPEGCLIICSRKMWKMTIRDIKRKLVPLDFIERERIRMMLFNPQEFTIDDSGRIPIPAKLKKLAGLSREKKVVLVGCGNRIEIWNRERWKGEIATWQEGLREFYGDPMVPHNVSKN
jgi:MraZ protein